MFTRGRKFPLVIFSIIAVTLIVAAFNYGSYYLVVEDYESGNIIFRKKVHDKSTFGIEYDHSVGKEPTSEWYQVDGTTLVLKEHWYSTLGAGLPADALYDFRMEDGKMILYNIDQSMDSIVYRTGRVANHRLIIDDEIIYFNDFSQGGSANKIYLMRGL